VRDLLACPAFAVRVSHIVAGEAVPNDVHLARRLWTGFETLHAVTYFAPECAEANRGLGLKGFWMGYFATRAAPMGTPLAAEIGEAFFSFRPSMIERAIPDAWSFADKHDILETRAGSAAGVLRSAIPDVEARAEPIIELLEAVASDDSIEGLLATPNRALPQRTDVVERLWQACTTIREHRGDAHVVALRSEGLDPCESLVLFTANGVVSKDWLQKARGWTDDEWDSATKTLVTRDLLSADGQLTAKGSDVRSAVETMTDLEAIKPWAAIPAAELNRVGETLMSMAQSIADAQTLSYPNPIGLPLPEPWPQP